MPVVVDMGGDLWNSGDDGVEGKRRVENGELDSYGEPLASSRVIDSHRRGILTMLPYELSRSACGIVLESVVVNARFSS